LNTIYFDNSATTKPYQEVIDVVCKTMLESYANPSALHYAGINSERLITEARKIISNTLGCKSDELIFTSGGTEADNIAT